MASDPCRVVVVGGDPLSRSGLVALLAGRDDVRVEADVAPSRRLQGVLDDVAADVLLWDLPPWDEADLPAFGDRDVPVLALVSDEDAAGDALAAGARGVLLRDGDRPRLAAALCAVACGLVVLDPGLGEALLRERPVQEAGLVEELTPREREVLQLLGSGLSNRQIAERLGISSHTAKFHVNAILGKLDARTRTDAVVRAARLGLLVL